MILVDTGPLIALFDPKDKMHESCKEILKTIEEKICTTIPVLTEAFHILTPESISSDRLKDFIVKGGLSILFMDEKVIERCFELMEKYKDHPMDLADASLIASAEKLETRKIFTIDRNDFETYRIQKGHKYLSPEILS